MNLSHFFIERPIFATVLSIFITLIGAVAYFTLPVAQYPEIAPPTIVVSANYPGASAEVVSNTVAAPLEQEINGVEDMLYMTSQATGDGMLSITVTFALGTDLDTRAGAGAEPRGRGRARLPEEVRRLGITVRKNSPDLMMVIHLSSPDQSRDQLYISNYATLQVKDVLTRIDGVGDVRCSARATTPCASGSILSKHGGAQSHGRRSGRRPAGAERAGGVRRAQSAAGAADPGAFQLSIETLGRLVDAAAVLQHRRQDRSRRARHPRPRHRPGGACGAGLRRQRLSRRRLPAVPLAHLPAAGLQRAGDR